VTLSPLGAAIAELGADAGVTAITTRIRPVEPGENDAKGPGSYVPFVVLVTLDDPWQASTAIAMTSLGLRCYAETFARAEMLYLACAAVFHRRGPRVATSGLGIYYSSAVGGPTLGKDPDTQQPYAYGVVELNRSIQAIPV
jgi:hypothetical protein